MRLIPVDTARDTGRRPPQLIELIHGIRWIAFGSTALPESMPRSWQQCAAEDLAIEKHENLKLLAVAEQIAYAHLATGRMRCAKVYPSARPGGGEGPLQLDILDPEQLKAASFRSHWQDGELILVIQLREEDTARRHQDILLFWNEVEEARREFVRATRPESEWIATEHRDRLAQAASRTLLGIPSRATSKSGRVGRPSKRKYAPLYLRFAERLKSMGLPEAKRLKQAALIADMIELARTMPGYDNLHEDTIKAEAIAIRDFLLGRDPSN